MTEHILNFSIGLDDESIIKRVQETAVKQITKDLEISVLNNVFESTSYYSEPCKVNTKGEVTLSDKARLQNWAKQEIEKTLETWKPEIMDRVVAGLVNKLARSKKFTEAVKEKVGEADD